MNMMTTLKWLHMAIGGILMLSLSVMIAPLAVPAGMAPPLAARAPQPQPVDAVAAQAGAAPLAGDYSGVVALQFTVAGVYSDTLVLPPPPAEGAPAPPDLGVIDLALKLSQSSGALSGHVSLDKTLVFAVAHTIQSGNGTLKIGPYVSGSFDGSKLTLVSERVAATLDGQPIQRQFRLSGTLGASDGSTISGEYRETLWGAARQPITVVGAFTLQRPVFPTDAPAPGNKAPDAAADSAITSQGKAITINVLSNDRDANGDTLTITAVSKPQFGSVTISGQSVIYTPNASFVGRDSFSYFVSDGQDNTSAGSVTVTVGGQSGSATLYLPLIRR